MSSNEILKPSYSNCQNLTNLEWPIALRKGTRKCTQHPISQFVSNRRLSLQHSAFLSNLDSETILRTIHEALKDKN